MIANDYRGIARILAIAGIAAVAGPLMPAAEPGLAAPNRAWIRPTIVHIQPGQSQQFRVASMPARLEAAALLPSVKWSVNEVLGGSAEFGRIGDDGLYRAPSSIPRPREVRIRAEVQGAGNPVLWATVIVGRGQPSYKPVRSWTEPLDKLERFVNPHGLAVDNDGNIIVVDELAGRVFRFSPEGKFLLEIGRGPGREPGQFTKPRHAAVDKNGLIYVSDEKSDRPRIQVFDPSGRFLRIFGEKGTRPGMFLRAHGMQFDAKGRLFVVDVDNARVSVFGPGMDFLYHWGKDGMYPGELNAPHGLVLDPSGDVFVSGYYGPVQKFTCDGRFLFAFGYGQPPDGPVHFHAVGGDRWGNVYVTVRNRGNRPNEVSVMKYNNNGDFVTSWRLSTEDREVNWVTADGSGLVYTAFRGKTHVGVEVFRPE